MLVAQPFLDLCNSRFMVEGVGGGGGAQGVGADLEAKGQGVASHELIDAIGCAIPMPPQKSAERLKGGGPAPDQPKPAPPASIQR
jgi:hypothetical protein